MKKHILPLTLFFLALTSTAQTKKDKDRAAIKTLCGCYEIEFNIGHYYATKEIDCPFLKDVVIRFYISNSDENYHVPLLISPFSYSTYRGS